MSVVDEKSHRLLGSPEQLLQVALAALGLAGDRHRLLRRQIVEQGRKQQGTVIFALSTDSERDTITRPSRSRSARNRATGRSCPTNDRGHSDQACRP